MYFPDDLLEIVVDHVEKGEGIYAAKALRAMARVSTVFAYRAANHEDNITPEQS